MPGPHFPYLSPRAVALSFGVIAVGCGEAQFLASRPIEQAEPVAVTAQGGEGGTTQADPPSSGGTGSVALTGGTAPIVEPLDPRPVLRVVGQRLLGRCDENVVLRGANEMVIWSAERDGLPWFDEMSKLGANATRIVWLAEGTGEELDRVVGNAVAAGLIPVVELHDISFDNVDLEPEDPAVPGLVVGYWTSPEIIDVLQKYEESLILEVAEQIGDLPTTAEWVARYKTILEDLRAGGYRGPIVLDAPFGGFHVDDFLEGAREVLDADPNMNAMYSMEAWSGPVEDVLARVQKVYDAGIPFYLGEFSGYFSDSCPDTLTDLSPLLARYQELGIGWFAWSWGGVGNMGCDGALDMTKGGHIDAFTDWGGLVGQSDPNSIAQTSVRLTTLTGDSCPD